MMWTMTDTKQATLPLPNPGDWTDAPGAATILGRNRSTVYDFVAGGLITAYLVGGKQLFWVPELIEVRDAMARLTRVKRRDHRG